jgi:hypothetical protein
MSMALAPPDYRPDRTRHQVACSRSSLRSVAEGAPWGRFGELFAYREERGVLTPE